MITPWDSPQGKPVETTNAHLEQMMVQSTPLINIGKPRVIRIDIDISPTLRPKVFENIRKERGELGCVQICTYGTISTKAAIKTAMRGYRSEEFPSGIDLDEAEYISSLVPSER